MSLQALSELFDVGQQHTQENLACPKCEAKATHGSFDASVDGCCQTQNCFCFVRCSSATCEGKWYICMKCNTKLGKKSNASRHASNNKEIHRNFHYEYSRSTANDDASNDWADTATGEQGQDDNTTEISTSQLPFWVLNESAATDSSRVSRIVIIL